MTRHAIRCLALCSLALGCAVSRDATHQPVAKEQPVATEEAGRAMPAVRTFRGTLHGGIVAVGGETTGWVLQSNDVGRIDVDVTKAVDAAGELDGKPVVIEGDLITTHWPERGEKRMLMADTIRPAEPQKHRRGPR